MTIGVCNIVTALSARENLFLTDEKGQVCEYRFPDTGNSNREAIMIKEEIDRSDNALDFPVSNAAMLGRRGPL